ncbi:MAG: hypothetical protein AABX79_00245 [Nanoarchaeota archaeon]
MKQVILDTSFILTCIRQKIDFFERLEHEGFKILIPDQAIDELMGLGAQLALNILGKNKFELVKLSGKDADAAILKFSRENPQAVVATLDAGLKKKVKNPKIVIRQKKKLEIV